MFTKNVIILLLLGGHCAQMNSCYLNKTTEYGQTPLMLAAHTGDFEAVHKLVKENAALEEADILGMTALMYAAQDGDLKIATALIEAGASLNKQDKKGWTALMHAAHKIRVNPEVIKVLLNSGANPRIKNFERETFELILQKRHPELLSDSGIKKFVTRKPKKVTFVENVAVRLYDSEGSQHEDNSYFMDEEGRAITGYTYN